MASHFFQRASPSDVILGELIVMLALVVVGIYLIGGASRVWVWGVLLIGILGLSVVTLTFVFDVIFATSRPFSRIPS